MGLLTKSRLAPLQVVSENVGEPVIQLDEVFVRYRVPTERILSFKEYAIRWLKRRVGYTDIWALRSVSMSIRRGEVFGIVGPNGAGKSTLLKVVARVLRPTAGRVRLRGRVAPLLELGAGFNRELTGRENIFLNSAILGFTHKDIAARVDRIVEFAGLQDFVDAPVRTYSTGMIARLGFAVATDVQPDILIVDEVLSVGDKEFQEKSTERIKNFRANGSTILVVSHSLSSIQAMCGRVAWLARGEVKALGPTEDVLRAYQTGPR